MTWGHGRRVVLDFESTGVSVTDDRAVTACATVMDGETVLHKRSWLIAVEVEIPAEAEAVHGISTAYARANGVPAELAIKEIAGAVQFAHRAGLAIAAYNSPFDLSLLDAETRRVGLGPLTELCGVDQIGPVIDPLTIDRAIDRYRPGGRKLTDTCALYGIPLGDDAHNADADTIAAGTLVHRMWLRSRLPAAELHRLYVDRKYPRNLVKAWQALAQMDPWELHAAQRGCCGADPKTCGCESPRSGWYRDWAENFAAYLGREAAEKRHHATLDDPPGDDTLHPDERRAVLRQEADELAAKAAGISTSWPLIEHPDDTATEAA